MRCLCLRRAHIFRSGKLSAEFTALYFLFYFIIIFYFIFIFLYFLGFCHRHNARYKYKTEIQIEQIYMLHGALLIAHCTRTHRHTQHTPERHTHTQAAVVKEELLCT